MSVPAESMNQGIRGAVEQGVVGGDENEIPTSEREIVKKTWDEYSTACTFDKNFRQRITRDRRYASGTANKHWASDANIIGAFIDILVSFLYAKDPDVSARPAAHVKPPPAPPAPPMMPPMAPIPGAVNEQLPGAAPPLAPPNPLEAVMPAPPMAFGAPPAGPVDPAAPGVPAPMPTAGPVAQAAQPMEQEDAQRFAETSEIVISKLWKKAALKRTMKRVVRSALSVSEGWFKAFIYSEQGKNPELEKELSDARDNLERIQKLQDDLTGLAPDVDPELTEEELKLQIEGFEKRIELLVKRGLCADFVRAEDIQVSLDVPSIEDYRDADWLAHAMYVEKDTAKGRFTRLTDADIQRATEYIQRDTGQDDSKPIDNFAPTDTNMPEGVFVRATENPGQGQAAIVGGQAKPVKFLKFVEFWDHRDNQIKTMCDGVERWAAMPEPPEHASSRFYPFFRLAFYEVDGSRHAQSLVDRMWKLQDEYSSRRSSGRKMRERSIPGIMFNSGEIDPENVEKLESSTEQELIAMRLTTPGAKIGDQFAEKPVSRIDPVVFDTSDILRDAYMVSGAQQAQIEGQSQSNTATEADINQSGFNSRSGADRDCIEEMLSEFAQYTLEQAVQGLPARDVTRLAGPFAFWPEGMDVEDILTLVEVEVTAGTTGKPRAQADKEAWATLLPLILEQLALIQQDELMGNIPMAQTRKNIIRETLKRLDDRLSLESILATGPAPMLPPGMPGGSPTSAVPGAGPPATGNGSVNNPVAQGAPAV
jgi:hypothetical protein